MRFSRIGLAARIAGAVVILLFVVLLYLIFGSPSSRITASILAGLVEKHFVPGSGFEGLDLDFYSGELHITGIHLV